MWGQTSLRALEPAIRPMCPPGRSRWVTSALADLVEHRQGALTRGDVVRSGRDHEQVLLDRGHAGAALAQAHAPADQAVLLVHPRDPLAIGTAGERRVVGHPLGHRLVGVAPCLAGEHLLPEAAVGRPVVGDRLHELVGPVDGPPRHRSVDVGDAIDVEGVARHPGGVERPGRVDGRGEQDEIAHGGGGLERAVQQRQACRRCTIRAGSPPPAPRHGAPRAAPTGSRRTRNARGRGRRRPRRARPSRAGRRRSPRRAGTRRTSCPGGGRRCRGG